MPESNRQALQGPRCLAHRTRPLDRLRTCSSLSTYGKMPTLSARSTAQGPMSRKRPSSTSARSRWTWLSSTCSTMGSCSGGFLSALPCASHSSKAVSCSLKKVDGLNSAAGSASRPGSWKGQGRGAATQVDHGVMGRGRGLVVHCCNQPAVVVHKLPALQRQQNAVRCCSPAAGTSLPPCPMPATLGAGAWAAGAAKTPALHSLPT